MSSHWKLLQSLVVGALVLVSFLIWFGRRSMLGTKLAVTPTENINYSGTATEASARALGAALQAQGYFDGSHAVDVLLRQGDDGTHVSFVVKDGAWNDAEVRSGFEAIGETIAPAVGGPPITVKLLDDNLNTQSELPISRTRHKFSAVETIVYSSGVSPADVEALGQGLKSAGYFDGTAPATVLLETSAEGFVLSFAVADGQWDNPAVESNLRTIAAAAAPALGGKPVLIKLANANLQPQKTLAP